MYFLFETDRLIIRRLSTDDAEILLRYSQEEITRKELPGEVFENIEDLKKAIEYFIMNYDYKFPLVYGLDKIEHKGNDKGRYTIITEGRKIAKILERNFLILNDFMEKNGLNIELNKKISKKIFKKFENNFMPNKKDSTAPNKR